jgi:hypothetical protein
MTGRGTTMMAATATVGGGEPAARLRRYERRAAELARNSEGGMIRF